MKIFIEIPTWLGDTVMATSAIETIVKKYPTCALIVFGSFVSTSVLKYHPNVKQTIIDTSKKTENRYLSLYRFSKIVGKVDLAFSFRKNFSTKFLLFFINSPYKYIYRRYTKKEVHQAIRYNDFVNRSLKTNNKTEKLLIYKKDSIAKNESKPLLGIKSWGKLR